MVKTQQVVIKGTPDLLCCVNGLFLAIELKSAKNAKVDKLQQYNIDKIIAAGGMACVAYPENWEEIFKVICDLESRIG